MSGLEVAAVAAAPLLSVVVAAAAAPCLVWPFVIIYLCGEGPKGSLARAGSQGQLPDLLARKFRFFIISLNLIYHRWE